MKKSLSKQNRIWLQYATMLCDPQHLFAIGLLVQLNFCNITGYRLFIGHQHKLVARARYTSTWYHYSGMFDNMYHSASDRACADSNNNVIIIVLLLLYIKNSTSASIQCQKCTSQLDIKARLKWMASITPKFCHMLSAWSYSWVWCMRGTMVTRTSTTFIGLCAYLLMTFVRLHTNSPVHTKWMLLSEQNRPAITFHKGAHTLCQISSGPSNIKFTRCMLIVMVSFLP